MNRKSFMPKLMMIIFIALIAAACSGKQNEEQKAMAARIAELEAKLEMNQDDDTPQTQPPSTQPPEVVTPPAAEKPPEVIGGITPPVPQQGPNGIYRLNTFESWTVTFDGGAYTMFIPAQIAPSKTDTTGSGNFTISGNTVTLTGMVNMTFTITNAETLTEPDGSVWRASSAANNSGATVTIVVANNSDFPVNVALYNASNIVGGQVDSFIEVKTVYNGQSGSFSLGADSYGIFVANSGAQNVWVYPQAGNSPGLTAMSGAVNLTFTGTEIVQH